MTKIKKIYPQRKYYLHWRAKKAGIKVDRKQKTIFIPVARKREQTNNDYVIALEEEYNYKIQLTIV